MLLAIEQLALDLRHTIKRLKRSPLFSAAAILLMVIGIGASTLIFTVADALLFRPLPVKHPENLVELFVRYPNIRPQSLFSYAFYEEVRRHSTAVSDVIGQLDINAPLEANATSERAYVEMVTDDFLSALGLQT